jgi:hypothetical protein
LLLLLLLQDEGERGRRREVAQCKWNRITNLGRRAEEEKKKENDEMTGQQREQKGTQFVQVKD